MFFCVFFVRRKFQGYHRKLICYIQHKPTICQSQFNRDVRLACETPGTEWGTPEAQTGRHPLVNPFLSDKRAYRTKGWMMFAKTSWFVQTRDATCPLGLLTRICCLPPQTAGNSDHCCKIQNNISTVLDLYVACPKNRTISEFKKICVISAYNNVINVYRQNDCLLSLQQNVLSLLLSIL